MAADPGTAARRAARCLQQKGATVLTTALAEHLIMLATRAPSIHNTQPWHLDASASGVDVRADRSRALGVVDPQGRQLLMSCGSVLHHLVVVAHGLDLGGDPLVLLTEDDPDLVGRLVLPVRGRPAREEEIRLAEAVLHRTTYRKRFASAPLEPELVEMLRTAVVEQGAMLKVIGPEDRVTLQVLVDHAERELQSDPRYVEELASWVWDPATAGERVDGMPLTALDPGADRAPEVPGRDFDPGRFVTATEGAPAEHPSYVVVTTPGDSPQDWVRAGMALSALLLHGTEAGVLAQPLGQVTDVSAERARLRHELGLVGVPQLVLRIGRAITTTPGLITPRRPVVDVLEWSGSPALR